MEDASSYLFLAGGIGITPILPMISAADQSGRPWRLIYGGRSLASMAFRDELAAYGPDHVTLVPEDLSGWPDLEGEIQRSAEGVAVYACGPAGFLNAVTDIGDRLLPAGSVHLERFVANDTLPQLSAAATTGPIEVELRRRDAVLVVTPGETILEAVRRVDPDVPYSCEEGYCGSCEQRVLGGIPLHRDSVLSEEEAATNESMMLCVGWSLTPRLVLDL